MNLGMDMKALATPLQDILDLLILLIQSIFLTTLKVHSIVQLIPEKFLMVLVNLVMESS